MSREINLDLILALEKQIKERERSGYEKKTEYERSTIQLKRDRNSLLNVSILPPEILGNIFRWNVIPDGDFDGLSTDSYNFLLVCHHWFDVALRTPGLWSFWGNSIQDWKRRHARCVITPVDLVLDEQFPGHDLDDALRDALQDRASRDSIRRVHLGGASMPDLLNSVISSMVTKGEQPQPMSVESFIIRNVGRIGIVDVSAFFSRHHLPKLKYLCLFGCRISPRDLLISRTTALTTLDLAYNELSPPITILQLLSIISSNPLLQNLELPPLSLTHTDGDRPSTRVPLRHLRRLRLSSAFRHAFRLLNQLELPDKMDSLKLFLYECTSSDLSGTLGPYIGDLVRRRGEFPGGGLGLLTEHESGAFSLCAGNAHIGDNSVNMVWFVDVSAGMDIPLEDGEAERLCFDLVAHIPLEQVVCLQTALPILRSEELSIKMCNLAYLHLRGVDLSTWFIEPDSRGPPTHKEFLRGLEHIVITHPTLSNDWSPFTNFLSYRAATGSQVSSLRICDHPHMGGDVIESIERVVNVFEGENSDEEGGDEEDGDEEDGDEEDGDEEDGDEEDGDEEDGDEED